jgi:anti-sigma factor RsiW
MNAVPHPGQERLTAYLLGKLSLSEMEEVEDHLGSCADCRVQAAALEGGTDSFVSHLRAAGAEPNNDPALPDLLAAAHAFVKTTIPPAPAAPLEIRGREMFDKVLFSVYDLFIPLGTRLSLLSTTLEFP